MPQRAPKPCSAPGCHRLQPCPAHPRGNQGTYDRMRGPSSQRDYGAKHRRWREQVLTRDPVCTTCNVEASRIADHVIPLTHGRAAGWGEERLWSLSNGAGTCAGCHNRKTARERDGKCGCAACAEVAVRRATRPGQQQEAVR